MRRRDGNSKQKINQDVFKKAKLDILTAIGVWLEAADDNSLDLDKHVFYKIDNDIRRARELYRDFLAVYDIAILRTKLADFMASGKVATDVKGEYSRFDVRNSLINYLAKQFFPQAFLPTKEDSKKDIFSKEHTRSGLDSFLGRIEIVYTAEQLAEKITFPSLRTEISQAATTKKPANETVQQPSVSPSSNTIFGGRSGKKKAPDELGKGKEKSKTPSMRKTSDSDT
jgi:hypothetical protein